MSEPTTRPDDEKFDTLVSKSNVESVKSILDEKPKRGGWRPGSGRPKGKVDATTAMRLATKQAMIDRIQSNVDQLLNAQMNKALGEQYLMVKRTEKDSKGKTIRVYHEVVEDKETILDYLDGTIDQGDDYYYMTTKAPDNMALQALLDRGFGKADAKLDVTSDGEKIERGASLEEIEAVLARAEAEAKEHKSDD